MESVLKKTSKRAKHPRHLQRKVDNAEPASYVKIDTDLILSLPQNSKGFVTSVFRSDEISKFNTDKDCLWVEILNKSFGELIKIKKNQPLGFVVVEPQHLKLKYETSDSKKKIVVQKKKEIEEAAKADDNTGNLEAFLTATTFCLCRQRCG